MGSFTTTKGTNKIRHFWEPPQATPLIMEDHTTNTNLTYKGPDYLATTPETYRPNGQPCLTNALLHTVRSTMVPGMAGIYHGRTQQH